jgi:hypothetical protein
MKKGTELSSVSNDGAVAVLTETPFAVEVELTGSAPLLFHRWSVDGVAAKAAAKKNSKAKKEDDLESYVYRTDSGELAIPGEYFRMSIIFAAKYKQDPRSPRKSAMDLFKAGLVTLTDLSSLGVKDWDYVDRRRVKIQQNAITRSRPAVNTGWRANVIFQVLTPEYIGADLLNETLQSAGRLVGVGDFRPTFGRFQVTKFTVLEN